MEGNSKRSRRHWPRPRGSLRSRGYVSPRNRHKRAAARWGVHEQSFLKPKHCPERTGMRAPLERYCPLILGAKGAARSCPAGSIAEVGLRWCGATPRNRTGDLNVQVCKEATDGVSASRRSGSQCPSLQRSDRRRQRQPPFQRQNHRDTVLTILSLTVVQTNLSASRTSSVKSKDRRGEARADSVVRPNGLQS